jgi:hypothetical protein
VLESWATAGDTTHPAKRALRLGVAGVVALAAFGLSSLALGAASYTDATGDDNAAPDVTSVSLSEAVDGLITVTVHVRNFQSLPRDTWFNIWFDLDSNPNTGDAGDETLVRYVSDGSVELYDWDGAEMVARAAPGVGGQFGAGVLTLTIPKADLGGDSTFGVLAVTSRSQSFGDSEFIASDYAPDRGRSPFAGPTSATFADPDNDEDAAPDITGVRVADGKDGWITFAISTPNYATLPGESVLAVAIDTDNRASTGDAGAEILIRSIGGETVIERWDPRERAWADDRPPSRVRERSSGNVVTIDVHRSELGNAPRFGFALTTADVNTQAESVLAIDLAPDDGGFYRYALANKPALELTVTRLYATPARPRAGRAFAVNLAVRRSDTNRGITSGVVTCRVVLAGKPIAAKGTVAGGAARCAFGVPRTAARALVRGTVAVRVGGKRVSADFAYVVRA